jgi:AcrR family transcriptional regulator
MVATAFPPAPGAARARILGAARAHLFTYGYSTLTMDDLAHELGMSKKTLYVHFAGKDAIVDALIDALGRTLTARLEAVTSDPKLPFTQKLCGVLDAAGSTLAQATPVMLRDLQRFAPRSYQKIEELRQRNIPRFFGRLIHDGIARGAVRADADPDFAVQFWLQAIRGLVQPAVLDKTQLSPRQTLEKAVNLFFRGLLSPAGRKDYEKHLASCEKHAAP